MEPIMSIATKHNLYVIEDTAQAIGAVYTFSDGSKKQAGTIGHAGTTSFFPSKNLGGYGDGGAIYTQDEDLAKKMKMIAHHGERIKYYHDVIGCNSRLDTMQASILTRHFLTTQIYLSRCVQRTLVMYFISTHSF